MYMYRMYKRILGVTQRHRITTDDGRNGAYSDKNHSPSLAHIVMPTRLTVLIDRVPFQSFALKTIFKYLFMDIDKISRKHMLYRLVVTLSQRVAAYKRRKT